MYRNNAFVIGACSALLSASVLTGCEELGDEAKGEVPTTALQSIAEQRVCIPYADINRIAAAGNSVDFVLRDGSRWSNRLQQNCPQQTGVVTAALPLIGDEVCAGDTLELMVKPEGATLQRYLGNCRLGEFHKN